eukprot:6016841-Prymnesium_polylepis.1
MPPHASHRRATAALPPPTAAPLRTHARHPMPSAPPRAPPCATPRHRAMRQCAHTRDVPPRHARALKVAAAGPRWSVAAAANAARIGTCDACEPAASGCVVLRVVCGPACAHRLRGSPSKAVFLGDDPEDYPLLENTVKDTKA